MYSPLTNLGSENSQSEEDAQSEEDNDGSSSEVEDDPNNPWRSLLTKVWKSIHKNRPPCISIPTDYLNDPFFTILLEEMEGTVKNGSTGTKSSQLLVNIRKSSQPSTET